MDSLPTFCWDACFITQLPTVDAQHQQLVNIINRFGDVVLRGASQAEFDSLLGELTAFTQYHFQEEEALMHSAGLDSRHIHHHRGEHAKFLHDISAMQACSSSSQHQAASELLTFLSNWLAYHILGTDQFMARLMRTLQGGESVRSAYLNEQKDRDPATTTLLRSLSVLFNLVSARNRSLLELNQTLESRVNVRTSELMNVNQQLEIMAMTDVLTELPNRRHALRCLAHEWEQSTNKNTPLACMMVDADGFKTINDHYGHEAGDEVLRLLARCLKGSVRSDDLVCRLGGDEFLIICSHTSLSGALTLAEKLRQRVSELRLKAGAGVWLGSVSIGVAQRVVTMTTVDDLLKQADDAVYVAKRNGRNCVANGRA